MRCERSPLGKCMNDRLEQQQTIRTAERRLARALRMRHQTDDVAVLAADAGDAVHRAVWIRLLGRLAKRVGVPEHDTAGRFELGDHFRRREIVAFAMRDRHAQHLTDATVEGERRIDALDAKADEFAMKLEIAVTEHRARKQAAFQQNLKTVTDAKDWTAGARKRRDAAHDGRESRDRARSEVVAMREPARQDHHVGARKRRVLVPHERGVLTQHMPGGVIRVVIAVRSRKDNDRKLHRATSIRKLSITGFARTLPATSDASVSAAPAFATSSSSSKYLP